MSSKPLKKSELTRQHVIDAAISCIYNDGFHAAHTNKIAKEAGLSWGVLQYHFKDKDGLLQAVNDYIFEDFTLTINQADIHEADINLRIRHLIDIVWSLVNKKEYRVSIAILRNAGQDPNSEVDGQKQLADWSKKMKRLWNSLFQDGTIDEKKSDVARRLLFATLRGLADDINPANKSNKKIRAIEFEALATAIAHILLH